MHSATCLFTHTHTPPALPAAQLLAAAVGGGPRELAAFLHHCCHLGPAALQVGGVLHAQCGTGSPPHVLGWLNAGLRTPCGLAAPACEARPTPAHLVWPASTRPRLPRCRLPTVLWHWHTGTWRRTSPGSHALSTTRRLEGQPLRSNGLWLRAQLVCVLRVQPALHLARAQAANRAQAHAFPVPATADGDRH